MKCSVGINSPCLLTRRLWIAWPGMYPSAAKLVFPVASSVVVCFSMTRHEGAFRQVAFWHLTYGFVASFAVLFIANNYMVPICWAMFKSVRIKPSVEKWDTDLDNESMLLLMYHPVFGMSFELHSTTVHSIINCNGLSKPRGGDAWPISLSYHNQLVATQLKLPFSYCLWKVNLSITTYSN